MNEELHYQALCSQRLWRYHKRLKLWRVRFGKVKARFFWERRGPR